MSRLLAYAIALVAILALLVGGSWWYGHTCYRAGERAAEARMAVLVAQANLKATETEKAAQDRVDLLEKDNAEKLSDLDNRLAAALSRAPVVRVQKCPNSGGLSEAPTNAPDSPGNEGGRGSDPEDGADLAPVLLRYARDAEALRIALASCQAYGLEIDRFRETLNLH